MSTTPAPRSLLTRLVDDAAVFPPASLSVPDAWSAHLALRAGRYGDLLGPLLVAAAGASDLVAAAAAAPRAEDLETGTGHGARPIEVGVIARPGVPVEDLLSAVSTIEASPQLVVAGVELAHDAEGSWRAALDLPLPVAVEVGRDGAAQAAALDGIVTATEARDEPVLAKLRTQSTPQAPVPTARELAEFLCAVGSRKLSFKLTGGLHHAVAGERVRPDGGTELQHGVLNVIAATHYLVDGADLPGLESVLALQDADSLAAMARHLDETAVRELRRAFVSFGCCTVTDPLDELTDLGLVARP
ncbi:hypothetical protein [Ornithinimicrobium panacihumi]|uniref:hypothetical protein n=1 Tax=Ornithinimicrobium panacihumi TaxID=2008449 RepID=UPI003F8CA551